MLTSLVNMLQKG